MHSLSQRVGIALALILIGSGLCLATPAAAQFNLNTTNEAQLRASLIALVKQLLAEQGMTAPPVTRSMSVNRNRVPLDDLDLVAVYVPSGTTLTPTAETRSTQAIHQAYWEKVREIIPDTYEPRLTEFVIYSDADDTTDAFVQSVYFDTNDSWRLAINAATVDDPEVEQELFEELIIHELAHIITLNDTQIDNRVRSTACDNYFLDEGCPEDDSYFQLFIDEFWSSSQLRQSERIAELSNPEDALYDFYEAYENEFVSDYAATNPAEDLAETFAAFVIYTRPSGSSVLEDKIRFLYQFPELVTAQNSILDALGY